MMPPEDVAPVRETCTEEWREHVAQLVADGEVTSDQARVLDVIVRARGPLLLSRLLEEAVGMGGPGSGFSCRAFGRDEVLASLHALKAKLLVGVKRLDDGEDGEVLGDACEVLLFPGSRVVEWVQRKERALSPQQRALLVIQRRTLWFQQERDRLIMERWKANEKKFAEGQGNETLAVPQQKRRRTEQAEVEDASLAKRELEAARRRKIEALHRYNEAKDHAQQLLGELAVSMNCTVRDLYKKLGIDETDTSLFL